MSHYLILCIDDERDVLDSVVHDLSSLDEHFVIEAAESVKEARELLEQCAKEGLELALILCDHIMPNELGVDFLVELYNNAATRDSRKILLTGEAGLDETVQAINNAKLDYFISKPWSKETLLTVVIEQLTTFVIQHDNNLLPWVSILDPERIMTAISDNRINYSDC